MKYLVMLALLVAPNAFAEDTLVGQWAYFMKIHQGTEMPEPPEATLRLRYEFTANGKSKLYWWNEGQEGGEHCAREGKYHVEGQTLIDESTKVDPANSQSCSKDPDMQDGKVSQIPFAFKDGNLVITLNLGDEELFYVWKKLP